MHNFNYDFLKKKFISSKTLNLIISIYTLNGKINLEKNKNLKTLDELEKLAIVKSLEISKMINCIDIDDDRIEALIEEGTPPINHSEIEIANYRNALNEINRKYQYINFDISNILKLHKILMANLDEINAGEYKKENNIITGVKTNGESEVRFITVPATETKQAMQEFISAYITAEQDPDINQLILTPCLILDFLCIHPFIDGNGRMSRLLSLLLLYKNGFDAGKYISFNEIIDGCTKFHYERYKSVYYESLRQSSKDWHESKNDYLPFVENFLSILYLAYKKLDEYFENSNKEKK